MTTNNGSAACARSEDHHLSCKVLIENPLAIMLRVCQVKPAYVSSAVLVIPTTARSGYGRVRGLCATCTWLRGLHRSDSVCCASVGMARWVGSKTHVAGRGCKMMRLLFMVKVASVLSFRCLSHVFLHCGSL